MDSFTIKDLENLSGIKAHTIRIWEQRYHFLKPGRTGTNIRYYSNDELKKVLNITLLNKFGFKISHIDRMNEEEIREKIISLTQQEAQVDRMVNELIQCMVDLDMDRFEDIVDNHIRLRGIERTINQVVFPFLERIGILWITSHINPAQEHLVSNIIRQKLIVGIESVTTSLKVDKTILLFLPEGEHHELGMLFMYFLLKSRGVATIYLGANVPLHDVEYVVNLKKPDYLFSHLTAVAYNFNFDRFLATMTKKFAGIPIVISGMLTQTYERKIPMQINFKRSFSEVMEFIATL